MQGALGILGSEELSRKEITIYMYSRVVENMLLLSLSSRYWYYTLTTVVAHKQMRLQHTHTPEPQLWLVLMTQQQQQLPAAPTDPYEHSLLPINNGSNKLDHVTVT